MLIFGCSFFCGGGKSRGTWDAAGWNRIFLCKLVAKLAASAGRGESEGKAGELMVRWDGPDGVGPSCPTGQHQSSSLGLGGQ